MTSDYTSILKIAWRVFRQTPLRLLWKFVWNFGWRSFWNFKRYEERLAKDEPFFPAFNMISLTEACNLACRGCWVSQGGRKALSNAQLSHIIASSKQMGSYFFGLLGGEPLMYKGLFDVIAEHKDCYFLLFTNGTLITDEIAMRMRQLGNIAVLVSIEGLEEESDRRRGRDAVYERSLRGLRACRKAGLLFGAAASICKSNYDELVNRKYLELVAKEGAAYLWYYIYRPVGVDANPENALDKEQIRSFRQFLVEERRHAPVIIIDTYWDEEGRAMCPGATGMSHHISPSGAVEFCPPLQMAKDFLNEQGTNLVELCNQSQFLADLRKMTAEASRGCILLEDPQKLVSFLQAQQAIDTTSRGTVIQEYEKMTVQPGHDMGDEAIPEKNPIYRILKKRYFFGFGAYG